MNNTPRRLNRNFLWIILRRCQLEVSAHNLSRVVIILRVDSTSLTRQYYRLIKNQVQSRPIDKLLKNNFQDRIFQNMRVKMWIFKLLKRMVPQISKQFIQINPQIIWVGLIITIHLPSLKETVTSKSINDVESTWMTFFRDNLQWSWCLLNMLENSTGNS